MQKKLLAVAISSVIGLAGCGSDSSSSGTDTAAPATSTSFSGTVNKGIVSNATVEVCDTFTDSGCDTNGYYYKTVTSENGAYITPDAPLDKPLLVLVSKKNSSTTMKCDIETCDPHDTPSDTSDDVAFGESFEVANDWQLKAILPEANAATETVNVTSLTDIASEKAIEAAGNGEITTEIANNANHAVKEAFGIDDSITSIGAVDLTDPEAVAAAPKKELEAATYSANLLTATEEQKDALLTLASDGGYTVDSKAVADHQTDVEALIEIIKTELKNEVKKKGLDLSFSTLDDAGDAVHSFEPIDKVKPIEAPNNKVTAAKAFVKDVRTAYNSVQDEGDLTKGIENFANELEGIDELASEDFDVIAENVTLVVDAVTDAIEAKEKNSTLTTFTSKNGVVVSITDIIYAVDDKDKNVKLTATVTTLDLNDEYGENNTQKECTTASPCGYEQSSTGEVDITINSLEATHDTASLTAKGSAVVENFVSNDSQSWTYNNQSESNKDENGSVVSGTNSGTSTSDESENISFENIAISLTETELTYDKVTFNGALSISVDGYRYSSTENHGSEYTENYENTVTVDEYNNTNYENNWSNENTNTGSKNKSTTASQANVRFDGTLTEAATSARLGVYLSLTVNNSLGYQHEMTSSYSNTYRYVYDSLTGQDDSTNNNTSDDSSSDETADKYVKFNVIARVKTNLVDAENNAMAASVMLEATRNKFNTMDTTVTVNYNEVDTILEGQYGIYSEELSNLSVKNSKGVESKLTVEDEISGDIFVNGIKAGTIEETSNGLVLVRYTDGSFESIF